MSDSKFAQSISVVLPAYNEELSLGKAAGDALDYLQGAFTEYEVIVVDDGSTDRSAKIVEELCKKNPNLRLLQHGKNLGYGRAIANGFAAARHDLVFFTDADNQFDIRELSSFVPLTEDNDAVFGFRIYRYDSVLRCLLSWVYNRMV
ncbi:MAG: glycosyltransferase family 2 protein, partial [Planctomycetota bacterium]